MNEARKALINIQNASPGLPVGRFHPQLAIIADFFDSMVAHCAEKDALRRQLLEAHERFGKLLAEMATPPASKPDQAQAAVSGILGSDLLIPMSLVDNILAKANAKRRGAMVLNGTPVKLHGRTISHVMESTLQSDKSVEAIKNFDGAEFNRDGPIPAMPPVGFKMSKKSKELTYSEFIAAGWNHTQLVAFGYVVEDKPAATGGAGGGSYNLVLGESGKLGPGRATCIKCFGFGSKTQKCDHA